MTPRLVCAWPCAGGVDSTRGLPAVRLGGREGVSVAQVAHDLGVGESVLRRWCRQYASDPRPAFGSPGKVAPRHTELVGLKRELVRVTCEQDFIKGAAAPAEPRVDLTEGATVALTWCSG